MRLTLALTLVLFTASCGVFSSLGNLVPRFGDGDGARGQLAELDGLRFRSRVASDSDNRRAFTVATRGADRNAGAALEASRLRAIDYCLRLVGGTDIGWSLSPDREEASLNEDGSITVSGTCLTR